MSTASSLSPLASYAALLRLAGPAFLVVAFVGRLPVAMSQLGTLLLVAEATGSYGAGGLAAGALAVASAGAAPVAGAVADRLGQRPVVLVQSVGAAAALVAVVVLAHAGAGVVALVATATVTGLLLPQIGPLARTRWRPMADGAGPAQHRLVEAAFSYEGAADEASFVVGPALLGGLAVLAGPGTALVAGAVMLAWFGSAFALHPSATLAHSGTGRRSRGRLLGRAILLLMAAQLVVGALFGSIQTGTGALATAAGEPGLAGLVHALLGIGSVAAGLAVVALPERVGYPSRMLGAATGLALLSLPLLAVDSLTGAAAVAVVLGCAVAPFMIATFTLAERAAPAPRVATAMTLLAGATGVGYALGAAAAGALADRGGHAAAYTVTVLVCMLAAVLTLAAQPVLRTVRRRPAMVVDDPETAVAG